MCTAYSKLSESAGPLNSLSPVDYLRVVGVGRPCGWPLLLKDNNFIIDVKLSSIITGQLNMPGDSRQVSPNILEERSRNLKVLKRLRSSVEEGLVEFVN